MAMIRWIQADRTFNNRIILYIVDEKKYLEVVNLNQYPVILQDGLPRTEEEMEMFLMLNPAYNKGILAEMIRKLSKEQINWAEGEALSTHWKEYMFRLYDYDGKLSKWG